MLLTLESVYGSLFGFALGIALPLVVFASAVAALAMWAKTEEDIVFYKFMVPALVPFAVDLFAATALSVHASYRATCNFLVLACAAQCAMTIWAYWVGLGVWRSTNPRRQALGALMLVLGFVLSLKTLLIWHGLGSYDWAARGHAYVSTPLPLAMLIVAFIVLVVAVLGYWRRVSPRKIGW